MSPLHVYLVSVDRLSVAFGVESLKPSDLKNIDIGITRGQKSRLVKNLEIHSLFGWSPSCFCLVPFGNNV